MMMCQNAFRDLKQLRLLNQDAYTSLSLADMAWGLVRSATSGGFQSQGTSAAFAIVGASIANWWPAGRRATVAIKCGVSSLVQTHQEKQQQQHQQQQRLQRRLRPRVLRLATPALSSVARSSGIPADDDDQVSTDGAVERLRELLHAADGEAVVLTGAGLSTDSGIPDYRGPQGSYSRGHKPMTHDEFLSSEDNRKRYWARSTLGWTSFTNAQPNRAHFALADLETAGKVGGVITQNVDGLHQKAGSRNVVDLHGRNDRVMCMSCGRESIRNEYQADLARLNSEWISTYAPKTGEDAEVDDPSVRLRADGDADVETKSRLGGFVVPGCSKCGGFVKPTVVFFGDNIPRPRVEETYRMVDESNLLVAAGSSLQVYSAFRLVKRAVDAGKSVVVVNLGDTRAERSGLDVLKVEAGVSSVLPLLL